MKVKCIIKSPTDYIFVSRIYDVDNDENTPRWAYKIKIDNEHAPQIFHKKWFNPLSEIRNETIDKLLEDES